MTSRSGLTSGSRLPAVVTMVFGLIAAGCGGETAPATDAVPQTVTTIATTTIPAETTTTIDFDRPITQDTLPIPAEAAITDVAGIINEMRGQTNNVSDQMARLARFQELATPVSAQILDFSSSIKPVEEEAEYTVESAVRFRVPQDHVTIEMFILDELRSRGWNKASESSQPIDGQPSTTLIFRIPGTPGDLTELGVTVTEFPGFTLIDYAYRTRTPIEDEAFVRMQAWQAALRTPGSARVVETRVGTEDDLGSMAVVYRLTAETAAQAREVMTELQREDEFTVGTSEGSGATTAPLLLVDANNQELLINFAITGEADTIEMTVSNTFGLEPID